MNSALGSETVEDLVNLFREATIDPRERFIGVVDLKHTNCQFWRHGELRTEQVHQVQKTTNGTNTTRFGSAGANKHGRSNYTLIGSASKAINGADPLPGLTCPSSAAARSGSSGFGCLPLPPS